jgi:hypothetical protein
MCFPFQSLLSVVCLNRVVGGERNAGNLKELTVRTNINRVLNVAWEVWQVSLGFPIILTWIHVVLLRRCPTSTQSSFIIAMWRSQTTASQTLPLSWTPASILLVHLRYFMVLSTSLCVLLPCLFPPEDAASSGERVLVHCVQGMSRSATVVIAYLMKKHKWTLSQALDYVKERRSCVNPHVGFMAQLRKYEAALFEAEDDTLVLDGGEVIHTRMPTDAEVEAAMGGFPSGTAADRIDGMVQLSTDQPVVATVGESPLSAVDEAILEAASHVLQAQSGEVTSGPLPELSEPVVATYD